MLKASSKVLVALPHPGEAFGGAGELLVVRSLGSFDLVSLGAPGELLVITLAINGISYAIASSYYIINHADNQKRT